MHHIAFLMSIAVSVVPAQTAPLRQRIVSITPFAIEGVIVGRASCRGSTWLLTDGPALVEIKLAGRSIESTRVRGLGRNERPWGLACLADSGLWTLADYRTLVHVSTSGEVTSRASLRQPRLNVFGIGSWLLLQRPPTTEGMSLLVSASVSDVDRAQPWPGPTAVSQVSTKTDVPSGLVACGVGHGTLMPCWISKQTSITVSDGTRARTSIVRPGFIGTNAVDPAAPVWDVAATSTSVLWILTSTIGGSDGRRAGGRLTRSNLLGEDLGGADLTPRARVIVSASDTAAVVLTVTGELIEVMTR